MCVEGGEDLLVAQCFCRVGHNILLSVWGIIFIIQHFSPKVGTGGICVQRKILYMALPTRASSVRVCMCGM